MNVFSPRHLTRPAAITAAVLAAALAGSTLLAACGSDAAVKPADSQAPVTRPTVPVVTPAPTTIPVTEPSTTIPVTEPSTTVPVTANTTAPKPTTPKTTTPTTQAPAVSGTPAEITQKLAGSLGNAANTAQTETDPIYASIYKKYQSSGLTIRIPAGMYPPGATATTPRDSLAYEVSGGGQTWCLEKVRDPDAAKFYYVQRDGGC